MTTQFDLDPFDLNQFDLNQYALVTLEQQLYLKQLFEDFAKRASDTLTHYLQQPFQLEVEEVLRLPFFKLKKIVPKSISLVNLNLYPFSGFGLLLFDTVTVCAVINRLLGRKGLENRASSHFSALEQSFNRKFIHLVAKQLTETCRPVGEIDFTIDTIHGSFDTLTTLKESDLCLVFRAQARFMETQALMQLVFSAADLAELLPKSQAFTRANNPFSDLNQPAIPQLQPALASALQESIPVSIEVLAGRASLSTADYLSLQLGDVILLDQIAHLPALIRIGQMPFWQAHLGLTGSHKGIYISSLEV